MQDLSVPPHSIQAEQGVIGALMLLDAKDRKAVECIDILRPEMFYMQSHQEIYRAIINLKTRDLITVTDELEKHNRLDDVGGFSYVGEICRNTPSAASIITYAEIVADQYNARQLIAVLNNGVEQIYDKQPNQDALDYVSKGLSEIDLTGGYEPTHISSLTSDFINRMEARVNKDERVIGLPTGIERLDDDLVGMGSNWLITLFGRPSHGKTLISQYIASCVSKKKPVQYFTMEMSKEEIMDRFVGVMAGIPPRAIKTGELDEYQWERTSRVLAGMKKNETNIYYDEQAALSHHQIRMRVKTTIKKKGELGLIIIDYLGLMPRPKADRDDLSIGIITRSLKELAKEVDTPILLLAQANRGTDKEKRPMMSNLYGSSSIEADSDLILAVHRQEVIDEYTALKGVTEVIPVKYRHGDLPRTVYLKPDDAGMIRCLSDEQIGYLMNKEDVKNQSGTGRKRFDG